MAYTKYSLTPANNNATPPDGAPEGMLPSAVNDTMRDMMAQIRDVGDGIRDGTYTMTAAKITGGTITGVTLTGNTFSSPVITGGSINNTPIGASTANTGAFTTLSATGNVSFDGGSFVFNETGADKDARFEGDTDANLLFLDASTDRIGIGTSSPSYKLDVVSSGTTIAQIKGANSSTSITSASVAGAALFLTNTNNTANSFNGIYGADAGENVTSGIAFINNSDANNEGTMAFMTRPSAGSLTERMRITSGGELLVGKTAAGDATAGVQFSASGRGGFTRNGGDPLYVNRLGDDGTLVTFDQATVTEGSISVSGTTVSYNGGHLSRWAQTIAPKDDTLLKGTVLSNLDEMNEYVDAEGNPVDNEQLNKVKVSDVEGDVHVAGVFVNWSFDEQHNVDEINMAMTGDMIIRIAQGVVVQKGDLLMSAGDGTAKPQGDDIVRSKTIAKVTSNHVTCTYADGSYCVPCVLMAC